MTYADPGTDLAALIEPRFDLLLTPQNDIVCYEVEDCFCVRDRTGALLGFLPVVGIAFGREMAFGKFSIFALN